ncbi:helix-turn-helix protein [Phycisphaerae bacterium RAS1]|nr:helix-turn-helix protein [Phycisphaerae bacterium RAS1]
MTMTETIKRAFRKSGLTLYGAAAAAGIKRPSLSRFIRGKQSLRLDCADKLVAILGLELRPTRRTAGREGR